MINSQGSPERVPVERDLICSLHSAKSYCWHAAHIDLLLSLRIAHSFLISSAISSSTWQLTVYCAVHVDLVCKCSEFFNYFDENITWNTCRSLSSKNFERLIGSSGFFTLKFNPNVAASNVPFCTRAISFLRSLYLGIKIF